MNFVIKVTDESVASLINLKVLKCRGCDRISDPGIITLIKNANNLEELDLSRTTSITNNTIDAAIELTKSRKNNTVLKIVTGGTQIDPFKITEVSPFLQLVYVDLS